MLISTQTRGQIPNVEWEKCYGGLSTDEALSMQLTKDGGYVVVGYTCSHDDFISDSYVGKEKSQFDWWIIKLDSKGGLVWQKSLGGTNVDIPGFIVQTKDEGFIVVGQTYSDNGDVIARHKMKKSDGWIVKLNNVGNIVWQRSIGGQESEDILVIRETFDGDYILAGETESKDGDVEGNHGKKDCWVVKLDSNGNVLWQKCYGGKDEDISNDIQEVKEGGYILSGTTHSHDGDTKKHHGGDDVWLLRLDEAGNIIWEKCIGGSSDECTKSFIQTLDGGYIVTGYTYSNNGDVKGNHNYIDDKHSTSDGWIVKLDHSGKVEWQSCLGGSDHEVIYSIQELKDKGYVAVGYTGSKDGDVNENNGDLDMWIVRLDEAGKLVEEKSMGGLLHDEGRVIKQTEDDSFIIAGNTNSTNGKFAKMNHGDADFWIMKLSLINGNK